MRRQLTALSSVTPPIASTGNRLASLTASRRPAIQFRVDRAWTPSRRPFRKADSPRHLHRTPARFRRSECTDLPIRNDGGTAARTRRGGAESPRRCTPCAPAAIATSSRSLTRIRVRVPRTASTARTTSASRAPSAMLRSRIWIRWMPPRRNGHTADQLASPC